MDTTANIPTTTTATTKGGKKGPAPKKGKGKTNKTEETTVTNEAPPEIVTSTTNTSSSNNNEELTVLYENILEFTNKGKLHDILDQWSPSLVGYVNTLSTDMQYPLHIAIQRFFVEGAAFYTVLFPNALSYPSTVYPGSGDNLPGKTTDYVHITPTLLHKALVDGNITDGANSKKNKALRSMKTFLFANDYSTAKQAALDILRSYITECEKKKKPLPNNLSSIIPELGNDYNNDSNNCNTVITTKVVSPKAVTVTKAVSPVSEKVSTLSSSTTTTSAAVMVAETVGSLPVESTTVPTILSSTTVPASTSVPERDDGNNTDDSDSLPDIDIEELGIISAKPLPIVPTTTNTSTSIENVSEIPSVPTVSSTEINSSLSVIAETVTTKDSMELETENNISKESMQIEETVTTTTMTSELTDTTLTNSNNRSSIPTGSLSVPSVIVTSTPIISSSSLSIGSTNSGLSTGGLQLRTPITSSLYTPTATVSAVSVLPPTLPLHTPTTSLVTTSTASSGSSLMPSSTTATVANPGPNNNTNIRSITAAQAEKLRLEEAEKQRLEKHERIRAMIEAKKAAKVAVDAPKSTTTTTLSSTTSSTNATMVKPPTVPTLPSATATMVPSGSSTVPTAATTGPVRSIAQQIEAKMKAEEDARRTALEQVNAEKKAAVAAEVQGVRAQAIQSVIPALTGKPLSTVSGTSSSHHGSLSAGIGPRMHPTAHHSTVTTTAATSGTTIVNNAPSTPLIPLPGIASSVATTTISNTLKATPLLATAAVGTLPIVSSSMNSTPSTAKPTIITSTTNASIPPSAPVSNVTNIPVAPNVMSPRSVNANMASTDTTLMSPKALITTVSSSTTANNNTACTLLPNGLKPGDVYNYEMSDREGSSDDDDEDDEGRSKKNIPDWARGANLDAAVHAQHGNGEGFVDPDTIFSEISTCDLEEIFKNKKKRYQKRTSSGNWGPDRLTNTERLKYRHDMGFTNK